MRAYTAANAQTRPHFLSNLQERKRLLFMFLCIALLLVCLTACGGGGHSGPACKDILTACSEVAAEGTFDTVVSYGEDLYTDSFPTMYGLDYDLIDDGAIIYTASGGTADEISIFHLKDQKDVSLARQKLAERQESRRNTFAGYVPEEVQKVDDARIIVQGSYVALLISDDNDAMETAIRTAISG